MKKTHLIKWAGLWLLVTILTMQRASIAKQYNITVDVVSKEAFVIFFLKNYENNDFQCSSIRVKATVKDRDGRVALRTIMARNVALPAGSLEIRLEAGKEIIGALKNELNQPRIVELNSLTYRCEPIVFRDRLKDGSKGPEMVRIPAGRFRMGDIQGAGGSNEQPVHWVSVDKFAMGKYEVTVGEYLRFVRATGRHAPEWQEAGSLYNIQTGTNNHYKDLGSALTKKDHPIVGVSWNDATAYTEWLSLQTGQTYRLPTEAEWEYAARAGSDTKYWWGNEIGSNKANCLQKQCGDHFEYSAPVGSFAANAFGLYDTVGNVWEWICSEYENRYKGKEKHCLSKNRAKSDSPFFVRGGSWYDIAWRTRSTVRVMSSRANHNRGCGFRLARLL